MKNTLILMVLAFGMSGFPTFADDSAYTLGPDSKRQSGVPQGKVSMHVFKDSKVFPGTIRRY